MLTPPPPRPKFPISIVSMVEGLKGIRSLEVTRDMTIREVLASFLAFNEREGRQIPKLKRGYRFCVWQEIRWLPEYQHPHRITAVERENDRTLGSCGISPYDNRPQRTRTLYIRMLKKDPVNPFTVAGLCYLAVAVIYIIAFIVLLNEWSTPKVQTAIGIEAGAENTTFNVYEWETKKLDHTGIIKLDARCHISGNITQFASNPEGVKQFIQESYCFKFVSWAKKQANDNYTYVFLGASSGMRALNTSNPTVASYIIGNITDTLRSTGINHSGSYAEILTETHEGVLSWISINSLLDTFGVVAAGSPQEGHSPGVIDWGVESVNISFQIKNTEPVTPHIEKTTLYDKEYTIFAQSNFCYGQAEAAKRYFVQLIYDDYNKTGEISFKIPAPCQPKSTNGTNFNMTAADLFYSPCTILSDEDFQRKVESMNKSTVFQFVGQSNSSLCQKEIERQFDVQHCMDTYEQQHCFNSSKIPLPLEGDWLVFPTYWYVMDALNLTDISEGSMDQIIFNKTAELCETKDISSLVYLQPYGDGAVFNTCLKAHYMSHLLKACHFENPLHFTFERGASYDELSWSLGHILEMSVIINNPYQLYIVGYNVRVSVVLVGFGLLVVAIVTLCYACFGNERINNRMYLVRTFFEDRRYADYGDEPERQAAE